MDHRVLMAFLSLWSSGLWAADTHKSKVFPGDVRLVGGASHCSGKLEIKVQGEWKAASKPDVTMPRPRPIPVHTTVVERIRPAVDDQFGPAVDDQFGPAVDDQFGPAVDDQFGPEEDYQYFNWDIASLAEVCRRLSCGSVVSLQTVQGFQGECISGALHIIDSNPELAASKMEITCSESVRLVDGPGLCSGRLEVKSSQSNQLWSSVCEDDFDQQDAEVVCREVGCETPSVLQGALYGDGEAPVWSKEFHCEGHESALLDCRSSDRNTCSSGKAVGLTCSEPGGVRLVGGASRCGGVLEMKQQFEWKPVDVTNWNMRLASAVCEELDCGSFVTIIKRPESTTESWKIIPYCNASSLMKCSTDFTYSFTRLEITCSESVRLVNGASLCSGRLEVKSNQRWSPVCEDDFDQQDAEVVCRELGCGAPSVLQGALYEEVETPVWSKEFHCEGHESAFLDCRSSDRNTCSPGKAVGLTCSDPPGDIRLAEMSEDFSSYMASRCAGILEMKNQREWRPVDTSGFEWDQDATAAVCRQLDCGSAISKFEIGHQSLSRPVWLINMSCVQSKSELKKCLTGDAFSSVFREIICSDLLTQPNISSSSTDGVSRAKQQGFQVLEGSNFTIMCSIKPHFPGGFFTLTSTTSNTAQNYTLPAVNHYTHFLFSAADHTHRGEYRCVYRIYFFGLNFSSESQPLHLTIGVPITELMIRLVVILLGMTLLITALCFNLKASRNQNPGPETL